MRRAGRGDVVPALLHRARLRPPDGQPLEPAPRRRDHRPLPRHEAPASPARPRDLGGLARRPSADARALDPARPVREPLRAPDIEVTDRGEAFSDGPYSDYATKVP